MGCLKEKINVAGFLENSLVNGEGIRSVLFVSGCTHNCEGCHNRAMQNKEYGEPIELDNVYERIMKNYPLINGVTFSGGEPFENSDILHKLAEKIKNNSDMNIWCYTGYRYEDLINSGRREWKELLKNIDVLVDGKFLKELKDESLRYRGSKNQRVINVQESIISNSIIKLDV
ncbi:anaerobic ribonucleoside-triphosphate reductase activating protein [Oceanirhabdus sp. W0125-5]|uniref:anaerobic ribonucleoside-triphosphate reductase activating protein n=1 Tax=Oceanirhabdus sp. W0125-5 TaxID=2999116 RepID=UPI0022F336AF|nr:anaerobic ribonucleoside-triphosphate reductase activating protein [Oceanirhabdus sp. W0125-5]WBW98304.1 anaerobic ribonucleoside-triphosphate reductase activating protein [Oceanirhabdus sp. W0125-5]